jgi:hypothetical protein
MIVKAEVAGFAPGVIEGGENWQVAPSGKVEDVQASRTALWNPFCAVAVMVKRAGVPGSRVKVPGFAVRLNCAAPTTTCWTAVTHSMHSFRLRGSPLSYCGYLRSGK